MSRLKTCKLCGLSIQLDDPTVPFENRYVHERCFDNWMKTALDIKSKELKAKQSNSKNGTKAERKKKQKELKEKLSEEEYQNKVKYYEYFGTLLDDHIVTSKIRARTNDYIRDYRISYKGLYETLVYLNEFSNVELKGDIIGLLPYFFTEAREFYQNIERLKKENIQNRISYNTKKVFIKKKEREIQQIDITQE